MRTIINAQIKTHGTGGAALRRLGACGARVSVPVRSDLTGQGSNPRWNRAGAFCLGPNGEGIGRRVNASHAINQYAADHSLHYRAKPLKSHFQNLRIYDPQAICGEVVSAQFHDGEIQNV